MAEPCALCSKVLKEAYRVCDRSGKPTQIGTVIVNLLDEALCENTPSTVCRKCRYDLLHLEKLKKEYEEVKSQLKTTLKRTEHLSSYKGCKCFVYDFPYPVGTLTKISRPWRVA